MALCHHISLNTDMMIQDIGGEKGGSMGYNPTCFLSDPKDFDFLQQN